MLIKQNVATKQFANLVLINHAPVNVPFVLKIAQLLRQRNLISLYKSWKYTVSIKQKDASGWESRKN